MVVHKGNQMVIQIMKVAMLLITLAMMACAQKPEAKKESLKTASSTACHDGDGRGLIGSYSEICTGGKWVPKPECSDASDSSGVLTSAVSGPGEHIYYKCIGGKFVIDVEAETLAAEGRKRHQEFIIAVRTRRLTPQEAKRLDRDLYIESYGGWRTVMPGDKGYLCEKDAQLTALLIAQIDLWGDKPKDVDLLLEYINVGTCDEGKALAYSITVDRLKALVKELASK